MRPDRAPRPALSGRLDPAADRYLRSCVEVLRRAPGFDLVGVYLYGSAVIGEFYPGRSDVDVVAVVDAPLAPALALSIGAQVSAVPRPFGVKGLDLAVVAAAAAASGSPSPPFELKLLTFYGRARTGVDEPDGDPRLVMNLACCRDHGVAVTGPPAQQVFVPADRGTYLAVLRAELAMRWMPAHYLVLNACRDWRFATDGVICSKVAGGRWAAGRLADGWLVEASLQWQVDGAGPVLDRVEVERFLVQVADRLDVPDPRVAST